MTKRFLETALLTMVLPLFWGTYAHCTPTLVDEVAVIVNGMPILKSEILALVHQSVAGPSSEHLTEAAAKNVLIEELLYLAECKSLFQNTDDSEALDHKRKIMQQNHMNQNQFKAALEAQGLTENGYLERVKRQICKGKLLNVKVKSRINVSKADILEAFKERYGSAAGEARLHLIQLLLRPGLTLDANTAAADKSFMLALKRRLESKNSNQSFIDSAKIATKTQKRLFVTDLESVGQGELSFPELEKVVFAAKEGEIVGPIHSKDGWRLMYIKKRDLSAPTSLEKIEKTLQEELWTQRYEQAIQVYTNGLKGAASIIEPGH